MLSYETGNLKRLLGTQLAAVHLQWFAEIPLDGPPAGQPVSQEPAAPAPAAGQPVAPVQEPAPGKARGVGKPKVPKPFHTHTAPDGKVHSFADAKALNDAMTKSFFAESDYSKKSKANADYAKKLQQREQELETLSKSVNASRDKYASFEKGSRTHPEAFATFSDAVLTPPSPDGAYDRIMTEVKGLFEEFEKKLAPINDFQAQQQFDSGRDGVFTDLSAEMPGIDRGEVEQLMETAAGDPLALTRMFAYAAAHMKTLQPGSPEQQRSVAEAAAAKRKGQLLPGGSPPTEEKTYATTEEARQAGLADARAQGL